MAAVVTLPRSLDAKDVARELRELADALDPPDEEQATRRRRRPAAAESSTRPVNEVARQKAKNILRRKGIAFE